MKSETELGSTKTKVNTELVSAEKREHDDQEFVIEAIDVTPSEALMTMRT